MPFSMQHYVHHSINGRCSRAFSQCMHTDMCIFKDVQSRPFMGSALVVPLTYSHIKILYADNIPISDSVLSFFPSPKSKK